MATGSNPFSVLGERVPADVVQALRQEIVEHYSLGATPAQRREVAYTTACRELVDISSQAWRRGLHDTTPLNRLQHLVQERLRPVLPHLDEQRSFGRPQIAVREPAGLATSPHLDGLEQGALTQHPDLPTAIIGVYLDDVLIPDDAALTIWPRQADQVAQLLASGTEGCALSAHLVAISDACLVGDPHAQNVLGPCGYIFLLLGTVPHCSLKRITAGLRIAVYFRVYATRKSEYKMHAKNNK
ncbi:MULTISPECIES: hypothetical protein [unclassified Pseudomonas]|jgi:hypothetical protein|uniref:hypothetical protein n=1 Tax=unclassified Pseudomonas TaxID=196821 RepID=UPI0008B93FB0|nr:MULTISPECIES: hypothetical protein [unclassified Pseudomonas]SEU08101.1 hypothetical protein SAMN03159512_04945 [Pseudomonas sp. NFR09]SFI30474.1 hypothetical protein SAMN03159342_02982 [Pseudomonas sp. NFPP04]SFJ13647.1 hypothetical protein SAMN03159344_02664 [Pseudomonas sp. NFPP11]